MSPRDLTQPEQRVAAAVASPNGRSRLAHQRAIWHGGADAADVAQVRTTTVGNGDVAGALLTLDQAASAADLGELPDLIGRLVSVEERARLRLRHGTPAAAPGASADENLSAAAAAHRLGISKDWLYRNAKQLPFAVKIGRRVVFSSSGLERWNRQRTAR